MPSEEVLSIVVKADCIDVWVVQKADLDHDTMETNKKIDLDVASLKTLLESLKLETVRYLAGRPCV